MIEKVSMQRELGQEAVLEIPDEQVDEFWLSFPPQGTNCWKVLDNPGTQTSW